MTPLGAGVSSSPHGAIMSEPCFSPLGSGRLRSDSPSAILGEGGGPLQRNDPASYQAAPFPLPTSSVPREEGREMILEGHSETRKMAS